MKGEIARAYAELIKQIWSGKYSYVTPRPFKVNSQMELLLICPNGFDLDSVIWVCMEMSY